MLVQKQRFGPKWVFPSLKSLPFDYTGSTRDVHETSESDACSWGTSISLLIDVLVGNLFAINFYSEQKLVANRFPTNTSIKGKLRSLSSTLQTLRLSPRPCPL
jgi:hypothetical protein